MRIVCYEPATCKFYNLWPRQTVACRARNLVPICLCTLSVCVIMHPMFAMMGFYHPLPR